ncbi:hypothetical protein [Mesobacillus sp. S13]|uniref:hypothetical protein n=1 Tax=Mesobacillus sp. S13 TaxID=2880221 RepID=UPI001CF29A90|nr:hypothetical protein [Mesobacillus sp. S13]
MPFNNELANKLAHNRILSNPVVQESLAKYKIIYDNVPTEKELLENFVDIPLDSPRLRSIFSVDGSFDSVSVSDRFPSAQVGFIQFSMNLVKLNTNANIIKNGLVNPIEYNKITEAHTHSLDLPIFNTKIEGKDNIRDSIRFRINDYFISSRTFSDESINLLDTLYNILSEDEVRNNLNCVNEKCAREYFRDTRTSYKGNEEELNELLITKSKLNNLEKSCKCPNCGEDILLIDYLRLHELIDEELGSTGILSRLSKVVEHLYPINFIMSVLENPDMQEVHKYAALSEIGFIIDGPLAIYGEPAKVNRAIHRYLNKINQELISRSLNPLVYIGLSKTGTIVDYISLLMTHIRDNSSEANDLLLLPKNKFMLISDDYRHKYIQPKMNDNLFGAETYYGQDIVYFNQFSQPYVLSVLYPMNRNEELFTEKIFELGTYPNLGKIGSLINELKVDVYDSALLPIVLAHKYASISLQPGVSSLKDFARAVLQ